MLLTLDKLWKSIIEDFWDDFIRYFFPELIERVDFSRLPEFLDKDLDKLVPENAADNRRADILMKVFLLDGGEQWLLIHTEIQGYDDPHFARRMFTYSYRIFDKYNHFAEALVIFLNDDPNFQPTEFRLAGASTDVVFRYRTFIVHSRDSETLYQKGNPFGLVMQLAWAGIHAKRIRSAAAFDDWLREQKTKLYRKMLEDGYSKEKTRIFVHLLSNYIRLKSATAQTQLTDYFTLNPQTQKTMGVIELIQTAVLEEVRQEGEQVGIQKGRQEGEQLGIQKGERLGKQAGEQAEKLRLMLNLVQHTDFSDEKIAQLVVADIALVSRVRERVAAGNINLSDLLAE